MGKKMLMRKFGSFITSTSIYFDTKSSIGSNEVFLVRRASDNVEQTFTYEQLIDGTYATFLGVNEGFIKNWIGINSILSQATNTYQPKLIPNTGNSFVYDHTIEANIKGAHDLDFSGDWVVTVILEKEENGNSDRMNFAIQSVNNIVLGVLLSPYGNADVYINKLPSSSGITAFKSFPYANTSVFRLFTFKYISGVLTIQLNNSNLTLSAPVRPGGMYRNDNSIHIGDRGDNSAGKINKYKHFGIVAGVEATSLDVSAHNLSIMSKYGL